MANKRRVSALVLGGMMILGGITGLFWNEWRSAHRIATLIEGERQAVSAANGKVAQNHAGKLVHVTAATTSDGPAVDLRFSLSRDAIVLARRVEMYQWQERQQGSDGDRETVYERVWSTSRIDSDRFENPLGRANPPFPGVVSESFFPERVGLGDYTLAPEILARIARLDEIAPAGVPVTPIEGLRLSVQNNHLASGNLSAPEIGDVRISWREAPSGEYSVLARQNGTELDLWRASNDGEIGMIERGQLAMPEMFALAYGENSRTTWLARGGFSFAIFMGFTIVLQRLARMIPLLGMVAAKFAKPLALILTAVTALLTIAAGWLVFRPVFSLTLAAIALIGVLGIRWLRAKDSGDDLAHVQPPPPPPSAPPPPAPAG